MEHTESGTAFDHRIAFISIDNAVELIIKTYLALPKRARKTDGPSRKKLQEASGNFPDLLDLLEEYGEDRLEGIDLGDIEWYHRIRNTLYHEGNGVTIDPDKVDNYLQIGKILFHSLFGEELEDEAQFSPKSLTGEIVLRASQIEHNTRVLYEKHFPGDKDERAPFHKAFSRLVEAGVIPTEMVEKMSEISLIRNNVAHGTAKFDSKTLKRVAELALDVVQRLSCFI